MQETPEAGKRRAGAPEHQGQGGQASVPPGGIVFAAGGFLLEAGSPEASGLGWKVWGGRKDSCS